MRKKGGPPRGPPFMPPPSDSSSGSSPPRPSSRADSPHKHCASFSSFSSSFSSSSSSPSRACVVSVLLLCVAASLPLSSAADAASASTSTAAIASASAPTAPAEAPPAPPAAMHTVVIEHEAELPLEYVNHIHPYAWEHRRPDPYFLPHHTAYNIALERELSSFLEVQTHLKARSKEAFRLKRIHGPWIPADTKDSYNKKGFSKKMGIPDPTNAASIKTENNDEIPSDFIMDPEMTRSNNRYRRAVYGLRRRRMPYWGVTAPFGSTNPWHRQNSFFAAPNDFFVSKPPNPLLAIRNPRVFDYGRLRSRETLLPYGGYSSFGSGPMPYRAGGFYERPFNAFRGGWHPPLTDWTGSGYSGEGPRGMHDGLNNFYASPYTSYTGNPGYGGFPRFGAVPSFIPGDDTFFNFYDGLFGVGGSEGSASGSSSG